MSEVYVGFQAGFKPLKKPENGPKSTWTSSEFADKIVTIATNSRKGPQGPIFISKKVNRKYNKKTIVARLLKPIRRG
ncbi:MAG: hypothetical protein KAU38_06980, partial [Desulfobacterales bacterium]|nr:hypothetical protein [Desulfobacterales bacterium]